MANANVSDFHDRRRIHYKVNGKMHTVMSDRDEVAASDLGWDVLLRVLGWSVAITFITLGLLWFKSQFIS